MDTATLEELRTLRARAYGPQADIDQDPVAMQRLHELENRHAAAASTRGASNGTRASNASLPSNPAGVAPPAAASSPAAGRSNGASATYAGGASETPSAALGLGLESAPRQVSDDARSSPFAGLPSTTSGSGTSGNSGTSVFGTSAFDTSAADATDTSAAAVTAAGVTETGTPATAGSRDTGARTSGADSIGSSAATTGASANTTGSDADTAESSGKKPTRRLTLTTKVLWGLSVVAAAAIAAGVTYAATAMAPVAVLSGAPQIATLEPTDLVEIPDGFFGAGPSSRTFEFYGLTLFETRYGYSGAGSDCFMAAPTESLPTKDSEQNSWSMDAQMYSGCGAGAFPATMQFPLDSGMPQELRDRFPDESFLQFVFDGERIAVFLDSE